MTEPLRGEDELREWLISQGFRCEINRLHSQKNECNWYAYKRSNLPARPCEANIDKRGTQIVVFPYKTKREQETYRSVEVELVGEANETWCKLFAYGISPEELKTKFPQIERSLVAAWNALGV